MENLNHSLKELLGCRCHRQYRLNAEYESDPADKKRLIPAHTFVGAKVQHPQDRPVMPIHQALDLVIDVDQEELSGSNAIKVRAVHREVDSITLDAVDLKIFAVTVNGNPVQYESDGKQLHIHLKEPLKRGDIADLKISYHVKKPRAGMYFIKPDELYPQRPIQVWTQGQDDDARFWFPCFDEPRMKCSLEVRVEVPASFIATSNGALVSESRGPKTWTFHWKTAAAIPPYLVTVTVGRFAEIKEEWRGKSVVYLCEKGRENEAKLSFGKTPKMLELFSKVIGVEYPYEKYAQVAVSEFIFGGMENTSATTQTDQTLHPPEIEEDFSSDDLVSHELAHQWFGDLVTCRHWSHGWLNEGWATFMETVFKDEDLGTDETAYYRLEEFRLYENEDKRIYRRPLVCSYYSDPAEIWDRHLYQKGGLVLNLLRQTLGAEDFWAGVKHYLETNKGRAVETVDFQRALEHGSGRLLDRFFEQWVYKGGYPELKASFQWNEKNKTALFKLEQTQKVTDVTPLFDIETDVEFFFEDGSPIKFDIHLQDDKQTFVFALKAKPSYCRFDVGNHLLKTLDWAMPLEMLRKQITKDKDVVGKVWAIKYLEKDGTHEAVEILAEALKDDFWAVRAEAALSLGEVASPGAFDALKNAIGREKKSKVRAKMAQAFGLFGTAMASSAAPLLTDILEKDTSPFVRGAAAQALGKLKAPGAFEKLVEATSSPSWNDTLAAMAYSGLRQLRDDRALEIFMAGARYGSAKLARPAAIIALGEYGLTRPEVTDFLKECLRDPFQRARFAAADALTRRRDPSVPSVLDETAERTLEGHFKVISMRAARRARKLLEHFQEADDLRDSIDKLKQESRKLRDRIEQLEPVGPAQK